MSRLSHLLFLNLCYLRYGTTDDLGYHFARHSHHMPTVPYQVYQTCLRPYTTAITVLSDSRGTS
jgi:hypothetical protein